MLTGSAISVFLCLLHKSAVRSSPSVPYYLMLAQFFCYAIFVSRLQNEINPILEEIEPFLLSGAFGVTRDGLSHKIV